MYPLHVLFYVAQIVLPRYDNGDHYVVFQGVVRCASDFNLITKTADLQADGSAPARLNVSDDHFNIVEMARRLNAWGHDVTVPSRRPSPATADKDRCPHRIPADQLSRLFSVARSPPPSQAVEERLTSQSGGFQPGPWTWPAARRARMFVWQELDV